jgi:serine/threonine-protein kinase HipA
MDARGWAALSSEVGLSMPLIRRRVSEICDSVNAQAHEVAGALMLPGFDETALSKFAWLVQDRAGRCLLTVRQDGK